MSDEKKIVWVLGAGFSRSLGAPLLNDLLSVRHRLSLGGIYGPDCPALFSPEASTVYTLFHHFSKYPEGWFTRPDQRVADTHGYKHWSNAEHFIETLCDARVNPQVAAELSAMMVSEAQTFGSHSRDWDTLATAAKRIIAAECSGFLKKLARSSERKIPYKHWLDGLGRRDSIISFNYDRVIETLSPITACTYAYGEARTEISHCQTTNTPLFLKLHGSVDWGLAKSGKIERHDDAEYGMHPESDGRGLVIPGTDKRDAEEGPLGPLWGLARQVLREADAVVFIGFRFPETDARARQMIVDALGDKAGPARRDLHVVLGPRSPDSERVMSLLRFASQPRAALITDTHLYAEEYLSVASSVALSV
jgi:hypothetical protein